MSLQLDDSFIIADRIREKVEEYIEEKKVLEIKLSFGLIVIL